jgi:hypothetical protein
MRPLIKLRCPHCGLTIEAADSPRTAAGHRCPKTATWEPLPRLPEAKAKFKS